MGVFKKLKRLADPDEARTEDQAVPKVQERLGKTVKQVERELREKDRKDQR